MNVVRAITFLSFKPMKFNMWCMNGRIIDECCLGHNFFVYQDKSMEFGMWWMQGKGRHIFYLSKTILPSSFLFKLLRILFTTKLICGIVSTLIKNSRALILLYAPLPSNRWSICKIAVTNENRFIFNLLYCT